jgi:hypothetical protein
MIKITIELVSAKGRAHNRLLGVGTIENIGGTPERASYRVWLGKMQPKEREAWKRGTFDADRDIIENVEGIVEQFDRQRRGCWDLLYLALRPLIGARNPVPEVGVPVAPGTSARLRTPR